MPQTHSQIKNNRKSVTPWAPGAIPGLNTTCNLICRLSATGRAACLHTAIVLRGSQCRCTNWVCSSEVIPRAASIPMKRKTHTGSPPIDFKPHRGRPRAAVMSHHQGPTSSSRQGAAPHTTLSPSFCRRSYVSYNPVPFSDGLL